MGGCLSSDPQERTCCDDIYDSEFQCVCCYIDFCCCCKKMVEKRRNEQRRKTQYIYNEFNNKSFEDGYI